MTRGRLFAGAVLLYLCLTTLYVSLEAAGRLSDAWSEPRIDFVSFYEAGRSLAGEGRPHVYLGGPAFFNPPVYVIFYAPLTALDMVDAYRLHTLLNLATVLGFMGLAYLWGARRWELAAVALAAISFTPFLDALVWGQPAPLLALIGGVALLLAERRPGSPAASLSAALLILKPTLLLAPLGLWLARRQWRSLLLTSVIAFALLALPFLLIGLDEVGYYLDVATSITNDAFTAEASVTADAATLFNWNGVVARLWRESPPALIILALDLVTLALAYKAARETSLREGWLVATAAMLLITPHVHFHQWLVLLGPALAVYFAERNPVTLLLLLAFHFALVLSVVFWGVGVLSGVWAPALLGLVVYFAFKPRLEALGWTIVNAFGLERPPAKTRRRTPPRARSPGRPARPRRPPPLRGR